MEVVLREINREATTCSGSRTMKRARPSLLSTANAVWSEAEQLQDRGHGDGGSNGVKVNGGSYDVNLLLGLNV